ncbi:ABC transporter ATP-binding protein [Aliidongia dinghuensis]|uniref:ABC transporter ATP-binding protein n=1 Tax=Aliidongia dinghuensis TaxID=1867774 RepID=A0A8J3E6K9_9PROT|nr:ABC transporter ATP-binding protein [Aliidongia dinghuensis]GGF45638.1 ABC transporter ATP-binding protein [Aliidongia dinghuensis]
MIVSQTQAEWKTGTDAPLLQVDNLETRFATPDGAVSAVNGVSFAVKRGETIGIVGESGSGKSQVLMSIMGLLPHNGRSTGSVKFDGHEILGLSRDELNKIRGTKMAMIFQDPMTALNPYLTIGRQLTEVLTFHQAMNTAMAREQAREILEQVHIPEPGKRLDQYPHELSGGMRQRVMIAMGMLCRPALLIADEPTTALDVTIQAEILDLLAEQQAVTGTSIILVTHDLGVVAGLCDRVMVMYGGRIVEQGPVREIFYDPQHPYTRALLMSMPRLDDDLTGDLPTIAGQPPNLAHMPPGCAFAPRCAFASERCLSAVPPLREIAPGRTKACTLDRLVA